MKNKLFVLLSVALVASIALGACGGGTPVPTEVATEPPVVATEPPVEPSATLKIWADDTRTPILQGLAEQFLADYNVELVVEDLGVVQDIRSQAIIAIPAGEGPDIYIGVHDWLGALIDSGLVASIDLGDKAAEFVPSAVEAFTYTDGLLYGMPYATENLGLFYNTDLVTEVPTTWDGILELARTLKAEGKVNYAIAIDGDGLYNALPIQTAFGGYVFGKTETGAWNTEDIGLDSPGEIAAVEWMRAAVDEELIPVPFDRDAAKAMFEAGEIPFLMTGPWALEEIRASGVPYAIANFFPSGTAGPGAPFSGVQGFFVNPLSENVLLAQAFLTEYVATEAVMQLLYETGNRASAYLAVLATTDDPDLKAMGEAGKDAIPMPAIPEMGSVWTAANNGIALSMTGDLTPAQYMTDAANQIRALVAGAFAGKIGLPGDYQKLAGCGADWDPACLKTVFELGDDGLYRLTVALPAGTYHFKVALDGAWTTAYGSDGTTSGSDYTYELAADATVTFTYDETTHLVTITTE